VSLFSPHHIPDASHYHYRFTIIIIFLDKRALIHVLFMVFLIAYKNSWIKGA